MSPADIQKESSKTALRAQRAKAPFIVANRLDLMKAREAGCACGYRGSSMVFRMPPESPRSPASLITVSRTQFLKGLAVSKMMCMNCAGELRGRIGRKPKGRPLVRGVDTSSLQRELDAASDGEICFRGTPTDVDSIPCPRVQDVKMQSPEPAVAIAPSATLPPSGDTGSST